MSLISLVVRRGRYFKWMNLQIRQELILAKLAYLQANVDKLVKESAKVFPFVLFIIDIITHVAFVHNYIRLIVSLSMILLLLCNQYFAGGSHARHLKNLVNSIPQQLYQYLYLCS